MIALTFKHANELVLVHIKGNSVTFGSTIFGAVMADISGLRLDFHGTIREFPDLKDDIDWKDKAIQRFKEHIKTLKNEDEVADYIVYELRNKGYEPKLKEKAGFRAVRIK